MSAVRRVVGEWTLDVFWGRPGDAMATLGSVRRDNHDLARFEERLEAR